MSLYSDYLTTGPPYDKDIRFMPENEEKRIRQGSNPSSYKTPEMA